MLTKVTFHLGLGTEFNNAADAINIQAQRGDLNAVHSTALRFDYGSLDGFLAAIAHVSNLRYS